MTDIDYLVYLKEQQKFWSAKAIIFGDYLIKLKHTGVISEQDWKENVVELLTPTLKTYIIPEQELFSKPQ